MDEPGRPSTAPRETTPRGRPPVSPRLPSNLSWTHGFGALALFLFAVQVVTGVLLALYYQSSPDSAYLSVRYIVDDVSFGWLVRGVHRWAAELLVLLVLAHMLRIFFTGVYRKPRRANWIVGALLLGCMLAFRFSGSLLPWDDRAYWTVVEGTSVVGEFPLVGGTLLEIVRGGAQVSAETLSRFYSAHTLVFPWAAFFLLVAHGVSVWRRGLARER